MDNTPVTKTQVATMIEVELKKFYQENLSFRAWKTSDTPTDSFTLGNKSSYSGAISGAPFVSNTGNVGFFNAAAHSKQTVSGAKSGNAALGSLMTALAAYGLVTDSTSA